VIAAMSTASTSLSDQTDTPIECLCPCHDSDEHCASCCTYPEGLCDDCRYYSIETHSSGTDETRKTS
jgi:hypothetical protein